MLHDLHLCPLTGEGNHIFVDKKCHPKSEHLPTPMIELDIGVGTNVLLGGGMNPKLTSIGTLFCKTR